MQKKCDATKRNRRSPFLFFVIRRIRIFPKVMIERRCRRSEFLFVCRHTYMWYIYIPSYMYLFIYFLAIYT